MPYRQLLTLPNLLTAYRFATVPLLLFCLRPEASTLTSLFAFGLFLSGAFTDLADGYYARKHQSETVFGKLMDPLADKVMVAAALIMLIPMARVPAWIVVVILARELAITGFRGVAASAGIVVAASSAGKIKSVSQYVALCVLIFPLGVLPLPFLHDLGRMILYFAAGLTVWSGFGYFYRFQKVYLSAASSR